MFSKRSLEGYMMVDHRASGGGLSELAIATCSHCQRGIVRNPDRTRSRHYCPKCDHYICDQCNIVRVVTGECKPFRQRMDEHEVKVIHGRT